ncbi:uncharacterized protein I303_105880 [Kwoniella dejecticola CBS 10117]|uniref:Uncharacterized protein n=1 Tax=Kwoniella dejecticola CBS 10117 TaxID=1296121 RepID=A0A1A6A0M7_9TREE|nr:uncharacterized protein I303_05902 [Kwoniella dejecticola CBS 10117]OBR83622.1 hypothetical protein I303_05902 [Kwoniella dejecticola CBS 10117]
MLRGTIIGSATTPGQALYSRQDPGPSRDPTRHHSHLFHDEAPEKRKPLGRSLHAVKISSEADTEYQEEELTWFDKTVVWSRGSQVFRTYTYESENEEVSKAVFAWVKTGAHSRSSSVKGKKVASSETFGPFHNSQHEHWGAPRLADESSSSSNLPRLERTLVVFLQSRAHVYYPSGEDVVVNLPSGVENAWSKSDTEGGLIIQRALERRELRKMKREKQSSVGPSLLKGMMDNSATSILDDLVDLEDDNHPTLPRFYTLDNPFDEFRAIMEAKVENGFNGEEGSLISQAHLVNPSTSILHACSQEYPFVLTHNPQSGEIIFYRTTKVPDKPDQVIPPPNSRTMRPEEILGPPEPPIPIQQPRAGRPSLHRNPSSFGPSTSADRRMSSIADPLDRTQRRAPRMSRASILGQTAHQIARTEELQATLDPAPLVAHSATAKRKSRGMSMLSSSNPTEAATRRTSASNSSFVLNDLHDKHHMGLSAVAELDLRETTMMMGLERDEAGQRSDLIFDKIWSWKTPYTVDTEDIAVFLTDNLSSTSVNINIHLSQPGHTPQLYTFQATFRSFPYQHFAITPSPPIECLSAIPLISTRSKVFDTLILIRDGSLSIITSGGRHIPFTLPELRASHDEVTRRLASSLRVASGQRSESSSDKPPIKLSDAIGPKFSLLSEDGDSLNIHADFRIKNQLTRQCISALSLVLPPQEFFFLKREVIGSIQQLPYSDRNSDKAVWGAFSTCLRSMLGIEIKSQALTPMQVLSSGQEDSNDPIVRRLAKRIRQNCSTNDTPSSDIIAPNGNNNRVKDTLRLDDMAPTLLALHLVAQDLRLSLTRRKHLGSLVSLISDLAAKMGRSDWKNYWARLYPYQVSALLPAASVQYVTSILDQFDEPPDIFLYLQRQITSRGRQFPKPEDFAHTQSAELGQVKPCQQTDWVSSIYSHFSAPNAIGVRSASAIKHLVDLGLSQDWISDLPCGVSIPILEMIRVCQSNPPEHWDAKMYEMVGRWDLGARAISSSIATSTSESPNGMEQEMIPSIKDLMASDDKSKPAINPQTALPHVRFGSDRRVQEVERIMQTTRIRTISVQDPKGASEADVARYHQSIVNTLANRTLSIPVGQGMFEFGTRSTNITDVWNIPLIELSVKPGLNKPTLKAEIISDSAEWPCFHNGVASGLAISPDCKGIDSSWIVFNRPNILNAEHGGFLLGLGLAGHLRSLTTYHALPLLEPRHDFTSVGLLLGLACSYAGSEDLLVTKVLSLHTHALLPLGSMELNASPIIQSSALVGLGLVYAGSRNLRMAEVTLNEIGRKKINNVDGFGEYQESYSFSAAMAFGLIMLGRGGQTTSEVDRRMLHQLGKCISGDSGNPSSASNQRNGHGQSSIDHNLTSPGATLALGLMYLKSARKDIVNLISIPHSVFDLDQVRPDLLLLRTYARALILWEEITPTLGWIEDQLPPFIRTANKNPKRTNTMELSMELAYLNIVSGACFAIGVKFAGTATELAHTNLMNFFGVLSKASTGSSMTYEGKIRRTAARQCLNIVTLSLAMVMSGTGELGVLRRLRVSHGQEGSGVNYGSHMAMHMALGMLFLGKGHYTLGNLNLAIASMSIAFFPRFLASPGDNKSYPQAFRHLWALAVEPRCLIAKDVESNETVYLPVKLKVKEQSGGAAKKGENKASVTRQQNLISPTLVTPFENIKSIEIDSPRYWPITLNLDVNGDEKGRNDLVKSRIIYVKRKMGFLDYNSDPKGNRSLFIKVGSMTGIDLHYDLISPAKPLSGLEGRQGELEELVRVHSGDPGLIRLAHLFGNASPAQALQPDITVPNAKANNEQDLFGDFIKIIILECLSLDKPTLIPVYLNMFMDLHRHRYESSRPSGEMIETLTQFGMLRSFYEKVYEKMFNSTVAANEKKFALIRPNFISSLIRQLSSSSSSSSSRRSDIHDGGNIGDSVRRYLLGHPTEESESEWDEELVKYIWKNNLPALPLLNLLRDKVRQSAIPREVLEVKVKDVSAAYTRRVGAQYDLNQAGEQERAGIEMELGMGPGGWKADSIRDAIRIWTE